MPGTMPSALQTALLQTVALPTAGGAPDWIHLLPATEFRAVDGRGPFKVHDAAALIVESLQAAGGALPIDESHATDFAAPRGEPAPARGWIVALEARGDGIWAKVEWTESGRALLTDRAYRHVSAVIKHDKAGRVQRIQRAALTNNPALPGLTRFQKEEHMELLAKLRKALGLAEDADEASVIAAVEKLKGGGGSAAMQAELQASIAPIAKAAGLKEDADAKAVLAAVTALQAKVADAGEDGDERVTALQSEIATLTTRINETTDRQAKKDAEAAVDAAIAAGKPGVKALREHFIKRHMKDPEGVTTELAALPSLTGRSGLGPTPPKAKEGEVALAAEHAEVARLMGIDPKAYAATLAAEAAEHVEVI
jgi:phage I-like protein